MNAADEPILTHHSEPPGLVGRETQHSDMEPEMLSLRPHRFADYIGQAEVVETLRIGVQAALQRKEPIDHVLLHGPPGLGKTTLAHIIANEMGTNLTVTSGPALEKGGDLIGILTHLEAGDLIFVDEIHRLSKAVEEFLYPAMEDWAIDFVFDKGLHARSHRFQLKPFTLVGATTRVGLLSAPLRDRFGIFRNLEFYAVPDLMVIVKRSARLLEIRIDEAGARELAQRSRGTPRIVNRLLRRVRDYAQVRADGAVTRDVVDAALALEGVDGRGLTNLDRRYLQTIVSHYQGGPVGIEAIAATLQEEADTLVDVVEPFLLTEGFIIRTPSGRKVTDQGQGHLGIPS